MYFERKGNSGKFVLIGKFERDCIRETNLNVIFLEEVFFNFGFFFLEFFGMFFE